MRTPHRQDGHGSRGCGGWVSRVQTGISEEDQKDNYKDARDGEDRRVIESSMSYALVDSAVEATASPFLF